jgi:hypothetical protein
MALQKYANGKMFLFNEDGAGGLVAQAVSFSIDYATNDTAAVTLADGFSGIQPGAETTNVSVENLIPRTGIEFDYFTWAQQRKVMELTGYMGASKVTVKGFISGVGANVALGDVKATFQLMAGTPEMG